MPKEEKNDTPVQQEKITETPPKDAPELVVKDDVTTLAPAAAATSKKKFNVKEFLKTKKGKVAAVLVALALIIGAVFAVPASRYAIAGLVIKKDVTVELTDSETGKPVSAADVSLGGQTYKTDANGKTTFKNVAAGNWSVTSKKNYYQDGKADTLVPILSNPGTVKLSLVATGRQVPVTVINKITGKPLAGVAIIANDSTGTTTENGEATIVLPADKQAVSATFKAAGYNDFTADITVTEQTDDKNKFAMTPAGKVYFLSNRTGKLNVMSSNLDGSSPAIVVEGTGKENKDGSALIASSDWKYLALMTNRDSDERKLYLISTADGKLSLMDEGKNTTFTLNGWQNEHFVYNVYRNDLKDWDAKRQSIKSFNASTKKVSTLDDAAAGNGQTPTSWEHEVISNVTIMNGQVVYSKQWDKSYYNTAPLLTNKKSGIYSVSANGENKRTLKEFDAKNVPNYIEGLSHSPQAMYFKVTIGSDVKYYDYTPSGVSDTTAVDSNSFYTNRRSYFVAPSGKSAMWSELRDGKQVIFVGNADGANGKEVFTGEQYTYGWFSDDYILLTKNFTELYIASAQGGTPVKVTDYYRPGINYPAYTSVGSSYYGE